MRHKGFTYLEVMIVIGIIALFSSMFFSAYKTFSRRQLLKKEVYRFVSVLDGAKKQASSKQAYCAGYTGTYQVAWTTSTYTITPGGCSAQPTYTLPSLITFDAGGSVTYKTIGLTGAGDCIIAQDSSSSQCRKITILTSGVVNEQLESDCTCP